MSARYCVQRTNDRSDPPRFEWLATDPTETDLLTGAALTWTDKPAKAADLGHDRAAEIAGVVAGASLVRFGDAPAEETHDFMREERQRKAAERQKRIDAMPRAQRDALGLTTDKDREDDARAAAEAAEAQRRATIQTALDAGKVDDASALMSDEERARLDERLEQQRQHTEAEKQRAEAKAEAERRREEARAAAEAQREEARAAAEAQRAAAERAALALAEVQRRAAAGDEDAAAILAAKAEQEAAEKARREDEARRLREATEMALEEQHADVSTADLATALGVEVPVVELADEDVVSDPTP